LYLLSVNQTHTHIRCRTALLPCRVAYPYTTHPTLTKKIRFPEINLQNLEKRTKSFVCEIEICFPWINPYLQVVSCTQKTYFKEEKKTDFSDLHFGFLFFGPKSKTQNFSFTQVGYYRLKGNLVILWGEQVRRSGWNIAFKNTSRATVFWVDVRDQSSHKHGKFLPFYVEISIDQIVQDFLDFVHYNVTDESSTVLDQIQSLRNWQRLLCHRNGIESFNLNNNKFFL